MTWNTVNVLTISWAREIAGKLAWKILNELGMCWVGIGLVFCLFPCDVFVMYQPRTLPFAPSVCWCLGALVPSLPGFVWVFMLEVKHLQLPEASLSPPQQRGDPIDQQCNRQRV